MAGTVVVVSTVAVVVSTVPVGGNFTVATVSKMPIVCTVCWQAVAAVVTEVLYFVEIMGAAITVRVVAAIIVWVIRC